MINIELTGDQIGEAVVVELQQTLELLLKLDVDNNGYYLKPDLELIEAIKITLKYFMPIIEYNKFMEAFEIKEKWMKLQLDIGGL